MDTPKPIDVNMLKGILGNAKKIMNKVNTGDYATGNVDGRALTEDGVKQLQNEGVTRPIQQTGYNESRIKQSRLPESVKKMMMENPTPKPSGLNHTFNLEDVYDEYDEKPLPIPQPKRGVVNEQYQQPQTTMNQQQFGGYSENVLRAMMKDVLI